MLRVVLTYWNSDLCILGTPTSGRNVERKCSFYNPVTSLATAHLEHTGLVAGGETDSRGKNQ